MAVVICTAVEPVPMTPTRAPSIWTSWSQRELWNTAPRNESIPSKSGMLGWCSTPVAAMTTSTSSRRPFAVSSCQRPSTSSQRTTSSPKRIVSSMPCSWATRSK